MMRRRLIALLILLVLVLLSAEVLTGCQEDAKDAISSQADTTAAHDNGSSLSEIDLTLFSDGKINLTLVRPENSTLTETNQFRELHIGLSSLSGGTPTLTTDEQYRGHEYDPDAPELLMGGVDYPEVHALLSELSYDEYAIGAVGNKLVISAWADAALPYAVRDFLSFAKDSAKDGRLTIPAGFRLIKRCKHPMLAPLADLPAYPGGTLDAISDCADRYTQITLSQTDEAMFVKYQNDIVAAGYKFYSENRMGDNVFVTYTRGESMVYAYYVPYSGTTRIIAATEALLPPNWEPIYTKTNQLSFTLFGLEASGGAGGLGCMMQLEDGSFVIIDGGRNNNDDANRIYLKMAELAPDPSRIVVRAWVITHAHGDHYGALVKFAALHGRSSKIKIESFIFNFCDTFEQTQYMSDGSTSCAKVRNTIKEVYPDADIYKCLTGQVFRFAGADMEILNCMSDFLPGVIGLERSDADLKQADGNIQSIVVRFIASGESAESVMVTGDVSKVSVDEMCARFGDYLASDMMTVPHHGWNENRYRARNGTIEFYKLVNPAVVLWPDGVAAQAKKMLWNGTPGGDREANYYLINLLNVKQTIVAGSTTVTLILPYDPQ